MEWSDGNQNKTSSDTTHRANARRIGPRAAAVAQGLRGGIWEEGGSGENEDSGAEVGSTASIGAFRQPEA